MLTVVLAWLAALAACVGAVLFGQGARAAPRTQRRFRRRLGLAVSLTGPWTALLLAAGGGALTGAWLVAAAAGVAGVITAAVAGLVLVPH